MDLKNLDRTFVALAVGLFAIFSPGKVFAVNDSIYVRIFHNDPSLFPKNTAFDDTFIGTSNSGFDSILTKRGVLFYRRNFYGPPFTIDPQSFDLYNPNSSSLMDSLIQDLSTFPSIYKIERRYIPQLLNTNLIQAEFNLIIKPNPAKDIIFIEWNGKNLKSVEIRYLMGNLVFSSVCSDNKLAIETANFSSGIYVVSAYTTDETVSIRKLLISR
jgi:hypothetical protein